jgi:Coatomer epsilon subunit
VNPIETDLLTVNDGPGVRGHNNSTTKRAATTTMAEPDELYTLRAQFWLGHYQMALDEGKSIMRRPMSPELKQEREEFVARCYIAMKDYEKVIAGDNPGTFSTLLPTRNGRNLS